jgi:hypothetical protein
VSRTEEVFAVILETHAIFGAYVGDAVVGVAGFLAEKQAVCWSGVDHDILLMTRRIRG